MNSNSLQASRKARETHKENIQRSLEHRLEIARANGDEKLIHQLEAEIKYSR